MCTKSPRGHCQKADSESIGLGQSLKFYIFLKLPSDANTAGPQATLWVARGWCKATLSHLIGRSSNPSSALLWPCNFRQVSSPKWNSGWWLFFPTQLDTEKCHGGWGGGGGLKFFPNKTLTDQCPETVREAHPRCVLHKGTHPQDSEIQSALHLPHSTPWTRLHPPKGRGIISLIYTRALHGPAWVLPTFPPSLTTDLPL